MCTKYTEWQAAGEMALADVEDEHLCEYWIWADIHFYSSLPKEYYLADKVKWKCMATDQSCNTKRDVLEVTQPITVIYYCNLSRPSPGKAGPTHFVPRLPYQVATTTYTMRSRTTFYQRKCWETWHIWNLKWQGSGQWCLTGWPWPCIQLSIRQKRLWWANPNSYEPNQRAQPFLPWWVLNMINWYAMKWHVIKHTHPRMEKSHSDQPRTAGM